MTDETIDDEATQRYVLVLDLGEHTIASAHVALGSLPEEVSDSIEGAYIVGGHRATAVMIACGADRSKLG